MPELPGQFNFSDTVITELTDKCTAIRGGKRCTSYHIVRDWEEN